MEADPSSFMVPIIMFSKPRLNGIYFAAISSLARHRKDTPASLDHYRLAFVSTCLQMLTAFLQPSMNRHISFSLSRSAPA